MEQYQKNEEKTLWLEQNTIRDLIFIDDNIAICLSLDHSILKINFNEMEIIWRTDYIGSDATIKMINNLLYLSCSRGKYSVNIDNGRLDILFNNGDELIYNDYTYRIVYNSRYAETTITNIINNTTQRLRNIRNVKYNHVLNLLFVFPTNTRTMNIYQRNELTYNLRTIRVPFIDVQHIEFSGDNTAIFILALNNRTDDNTVYFYDTRNFTLINLLTSNKPIEDFAFSTYNDEIFLSFDTDFDNDRYDDYPENYQVGELYDLDLHLVQRFDGVFRKVKFSPSGGSLFAIVNMRPTIYTYGVNVDELFGDIKHAAY